jgi:hypothetical protein
MEVHSFEDGFKVEKIFPELSAATHSFFDGHDTSVTSPPGSIEYVDHWELPSVGELENMRFPPLSPNRQN